MRSSVTRAQLAHAGGFSLVEALVALGIITGGILAMASLALGTTAIVSRARARTIAAALTDAAITDLVARPAAPSSPACLLRDIGGCVTYRDAAGAAAAGPAGGFAIRSYVASLPGSPVPGRLITVCAVAEADRAPARRPPGACAIRIVMDAWP